MYNHVNLYINILKLETIETLHYNTFMDIVGLSILQNGKIPQFHSEEILSGIFDDQEPQPCIAYLGNGLAKLGIIQVIFNLYLYLYFLLYIRAQNNGPNF